MQSRVKMHRYHMHRYYLTLRAQHPSYALFTVTKEKLKIKQRSTHKYPTCSEE